MIILSSRSESKRVCSAVVLHDYNVKLAESSLYDFAVHGNPDAALSDKGFSWAKVRS